MMVTTTLTLQSASLADANDVGMGGEEGGSKAACVVRDKETSLLFMQTLRESLVYSSTEPPDASFEGLFAAAACDCWPNVVAAEAGCADLETANM